MSSSVRSCILVIALAGRLLGAQPVNDRLVGKLADAQKQIVEGDIARAETLLAAITKEAPKDPRAFNLLGVVKAQGGFYDQAESSFRQAIRLAPRFRDAYLNLGRLYQENLAKKPDAAGKAIELYRSLLRFEPNDVEALYQAGFLQHAAGDHSASQAFLLKLPPEDQARAQALSLILGNEAALGNRPKADQAAERLLADPALSEPDVRVILPALRLGSRLDLAARLLQTLSDRGALSRESAEDLADVYADLGDYGRAKPLLENLAAGHPDLPELLLKLGWVSYRARQFEDALSYLAHARDLQPKNARIRLLFGLSCVELGLGLEALKALEEAVALEPENPYYNYALGAAILNWKEAEHAIPYFEKYCTLAPGDTKGVAGLAEARFLNREYEAAKTGFLKLLQDESTRVTAHYYLGAIARLNNQPEEATRYLESALKLDPAHVGALTELGSVYTRVGRFKEAEQVLKKALSIRPENYQANFNLMGLYARTRDPRYEQQKQLFEQLKAKRWEKLTAALRTIEAVPRDEIMRK